MVAGGCARWRSKQDSNLHYLADRLGFQPRRIPITSLLHIESCSTTVMRNMADAPIHDVFSCFFALQLWRRERVSNPQTAHHDCQFSKLGGIAAFHSRHIKARLGRHLSAPSMEGYVPSLHRHLRLAKKNPAPNVRVFCIIPTRVLADSDAIGGVRNACGAPDRTRTCIPRLRISSPRQLVDGSMYFLMGCFRHDDFPTQSAPIYPRQLPKKNLRVIAAERRFSIYSFIKEYGDVLVNGRYDGLASCSTGQ